MSAANKTSLRLVAGLILAPIAPGLLFLFLSMFSNIGEGIWAFKILALMAYPAMLLLGVPAHLLLMKRRWANGWSYTLVGTLIGMIVAAVLFGNVVVNNFSLSHDPNKSLGPVTGIFLLAGLLGAFAAWIFWVVARPNRRLNA